MLLRAALGFAVALTLLQGQGIRLDLPVLARVKADIAAQHPDAQLKSLLDEGASALAARIGTVRDEIAPPSRARRLHS
jgi:hypothetical protein